MRATEIFPNAPIGGFVDLDGEPYYRIDAYDRMAPFLMSVPSDTDLWMFVASGGGLSAGRVDAEGSLFPYETVDRLHDGHHHTGPVTVIHVEPEDDEPVLWEPFREAGTGHDSVERYLYKNTTGNRIVFEEVHRGLGLSFRYRWSASDEFGWVRTATLHNHGGTSSRIRFMDGLRNILPSCIPLSLQQQASNLVDAYKKSEIDDETPLGIFSLTAQVTDRTEALETLEATTVWCCGLENPRTHLSLEALSNFRAERVVPAEQTLNGARGNYLVSSNLDLEPGESRRWHIVGDTGKDHLQVAELRHRLREDALLPEKIEASLDAATASLRRIVGSADGIQITGRSESWSHHFSNVLFNNMRGGVFFHNYAVPVADLAEFLSVRNTHVADRHSTTLAELPELSTVEELLGVAERTRDIDFQRLCYEYLPLYFSRRHGDPSRPWNRFSIRTRASSGERELNFEGNWRDVFQNWEALGTSYPGFLPGIIAKFVNASSVDGFNPYRITREGVEWETPNPDDPWANIGYWGDHQIIYLLKLLELLDRHDPSAIRSLLSKEIFSYVEIPYRLHSYEEILADPKSTIRFDARLAEQIDHRVSALGSDGKLLLDDAGHVYHVNLAEKLLVPVLSKLSNLVLDAGIWMNTQRPEWNDANNALGGGAVSVVTLSYLRRHLEFLSNQLASAPVDALPISNEVVSWFERVESALADEHGLLASDHTRAPDRKRLMDALGLAFSDYRSTVYSRGFSGKTEVALSRVVDLCRTALAFIDHSIAANRRDDGLLHTYNQLEFGDPDGVELIRLPLMLEGQVAALSSGFLEPAEALDLLRRLFQSALYDQERRSFLLYTARELPGFMDKNVVPESAAMEIGLLADHLAADDRCLIARDADGVLRFHRDFSSAEDLTRVLDNLESREDKKDSVRKDRAAILYLFESVFDHGTYTGRSAVMYGYEGLGCIYWHMVAKLLLAVQENHQRAVAGDSPIATRTALAEMYFKVRSGIGYEKTVEEYGAFPTDPYSHTPASGTARQPGMTGQVKEEILTRIGELGVEVRQGVVRFQPSLLRHDEYLARPEEFRYFDVDGTEQSIELPAGSLAFTFCQVPVVYESGADEAWIEIEFAEGASAKQDGVTLDAATARKLFSRGGEVRCLRVGIPS